MSRPPAHRLCRGSFAALERAFLADVDELKRADPLARVDVLTGSNLLAVYLRRRVAEERGAVANLRFLTFLDLARRLAPEADPRPQLPRLAPEVLSRRALRETPEAGVFEPLRGRSSLARLVLRTADDLRDAAIPAETLRSVLPAAGATRDRRVRLAGLAAVVARLEALREGFADATSHLVRAVRAGRIPAEETPLLVYGPYDLGGLRSELLARVASHRDVHAFVPGDGEDDRDIRPPVRAPLFEALLGVTARHLLADPPAAMRAVLAPTDADEARETVREILRCAQAGTPLHRIGVLLHDPAAQEPALLAELRALRLPFFRPAGTGLSRSPAGRLARLLVDLAAEDFRREDVRETLDLLASLDRLPALGLAELRPGELHDVAARLGLVKGRASFASRLTRAHVKLQQPLPLEGRERLRRACDDLTKAFRMLEGLVPDGAATWGAFASRLEGSLTALLGDASPGWPDLRAALEELRALEAVDRDTHSLSELREALVASLDLVAEPQGRYERDGLSVLSTVTARGLSFDTVLVPGLAERSFPAPGRPDPLLLDEERARIREATGRPLAPRSGSRHAREERFLFHLATRSARRDVVLVTARRDVVRDRQRLPSPFLRELLRDGLPFREPPLGGATPDTPPLDAADVLGLRLGGPPPAHETLAAVAPPLSRALLRGAARRDDAFTVFEGAFGRATPLFGLLDAPLSPSRLERFAACPYRSFLETALHLPAREPHELPLVPDALTLGELAHAALQAITRDLIARKGRMSEVSRSSLERQAREGIDSWIRDDDRELPAVFRERAESELLSVLEGFRALERERAAAAVPAGVEVPFGPGERAPSLTVGERLVTFRGRVDRVDREGRALRVVDYKLGRPSPYGKENRERRLLAGGERAQLAVYALAARAGSPDVEVSADYLFVERPRGRRDAPRSRLSFTPEDTGESIRALSRVLSFIERAASEGRLLPFTESAKAASPCRACPFDEVCGAGHTRVYERKWRGERARGESPLLQMRELP